jgi:6-pyruvoyltetrahydropterin/6-carboxytetrahydropterin synthase
MKWMVEKEFRFEASHILPHHDGKCARLHGHSWVARIRFKSPSLVGEGSSVGMVVDFTVIKNAVQPVVDEFLDHHHLNESLGLVNPTSENIAWWLYEKLTSIFPDDLMAMLDAVRIEETCTSACEFSA